MSDKLRFVLAHQLARQRAVQAVSQAPDGYVVEVREPARSLDQNAMLWPLLEAFAAQLEWPVNGRMTRLDSTDWKDLLTAEFSLETQRMAPGLNGGVVLLGQRTSQMGKRRFSEFLEFVLATAAERGVRVDHHTQQEQAA